MGGAREAYNNFSENIVGSAQDALGAGTGSDAFLGYQNIMTAGGLSLLGYKSGAQQEKEKRDFAKMSFDEQQAYGRAAEGARRAKIRTQLEESVRLRQRSPGRAATLLTSNLSPSGANNNTLLTSAAQSMGTR
jgi:hypothetical protein